MSELPEVIELGPRDQAESLWTRARAARDGAVSGDLVSLLEALDLGLRAMEILVIERLDPFKDQFPATIAMQLDHPRPEVDTVEDAITVPNSLRFSEIVDLLSQEGLACVAPGLHRGWEDRRFSCRRSRATAQEALEVSLEEKEQRDLLLLSAYRNRIFRAPPPVRVVPGHILEAFKSLEKLAEALF